MTKSLPSATKLRLSRIIKALLVIGCLKLAIISASLFDWPFSSEPAPAPAIAQQEPVKQAPAGNSEYMAPVQPETVQTEIKNDELPQGSAAAELAAASKPRRPQGAGTAVLPAPLVSANNSSPLAASGFTAPLLPQPSPLGVPLAKAGVIVPQTMPAPKNSADDNIWNILDIKSLPIPGLGSVQAAHAAALDMPVPSTPPAQSPFTPAEQMAPLSGQPTVLPGAPPLPTNIPRGQDANGLPLPQRQTGLQHTPESGPAPLSGPAPQITDRQTPYDPNIKTQEMARQQQDILMLRQQMDQRLKDLQNAEDKMKGMLREAKDVEDQKVKNLIQMYANMKPRMAAQAMEKMDERIAVRILAGMAPKQSGEILTYTNPAKTAKFTEMITRLRTSE